jgi:ribosomal protein S18 acetylase RimI-like enzyme
VTDLAGRYTVRRLGPPDADGLAALRREALQSAPLAFSSSPQDDRLRSPGFVREVLAASDQAVFGAVAGGVVGMVGISRDPHAKAAHRCDMWGLFVGAEHRRLGIGHALVAEAIGFARSLPGVTHLYVSATEAAPEAMALYDRFGLAVWGVDAASLCVDGRLVAEHHMVLALAPGPTGAGHAPDAGQAGLPVAESNESP